MNQKSVIVLLIAAATLVTLLLMRFYTTSNTALNATSNITSNATSNAISNIVYSANKAGFEFYNSKGNVTSAEAEWTVPVMDNLTSQWINIGDKYVYAYIDIPLKSGETRGNIDLGVIRLKNGKYFAFVYSFRLFKVFHNLFTVSPGDRIEASISQNVTTWFVTINDTTTGQHVMIPLNESFNNTNANFIFERNPNPTTYDYLNVSSWNLPSLGYFNPVTFQNISVVINGKTYNLCDATTPNRLKMTSNDNLTGNILASPQLGSECTNFSVVYGEVK